MSVLFLGDDLKMTNIATLTRDQVKNMTSKDLLVVFNELTKDELDMMLTVIKSLQDDSLNEGKRNRKYQRIGHIIEMAAYRIEQRLAVSKMEEGE